MATKQHSSGAEAIDKGERGQGLVEYMLIIILVAIVVMVLLPPLGDYISSAFSEVTSSL